MQKRELTPICLWSGPRNVSTALMYSFRSRPDTTVVDEPLYGHYLRVTGAQHPGRDTVLESMDLDGNRVMSGLLEHSADRPLLFMKQMAHHLVDLDRSFLKETVNVLLIRDPEDMLPSLRVQLPEAGLDDTGLKVQADLLDELTSCGQNPPVIDSRELLLDPEGVLRGLCRHLSVDYFEQMLTWPEGPVPEDGVWAEHWYHNVHRSTGFQRYKRKREPFPAGLLPLLDECKPYYDRLFARALRAREEIQL